MRDIVYSLHYTGHGIYSSCTVVTHSFCCVIPITLLMHYIYTCNAAANILGHHLDVLVQYLNVDLIRLALRKNGVLLSEEADKLLDFSNHPGPTRTSVIEKLVSMMSSKGSNGIYFFKKALEETTEAMGHQDILRELNTDPEFEAIVNDPSYAGN